MPRRLFIVDDDSRFRGLLRMLLEGSDTFTVVGEAGDGAEALGSIPRVKPDVVVLDVQLPDTTGFDLAPLLTVPDVLLTSSRGDEAYYERARAVGAVAFVPKHELSIAAIEAALG